MSISLGKVARLLGVYRQRRIAGRLIFAADELYNVWQEEHLRQLFEALQVDCVFDVGANRGQYALMLRQQVGYTGPIFSFEPLPELAAELQLRGADDPAWHVEPIALATVDGTTHFNIMEVSEFSSISTPRHDDSGIFVELNRVIQSIEVRCETLATALARLSKQHDFSRAFLKLDTQGMDTAIAAAAPAAMRSFVGLQCELAIKRLYADAVDFRIALAVYEDCGFALATFLPINPGHFPTMVETDCLMVRQDLLNS